MQKYYANNESISQTPLDDSIEITKEQYDKAMQDKLKGVVVRVIDNTLVFESEYNKVIAYLKSDGTAKEEFDDKSLVPEEYTVQEVPKENPQCYTWDDTDEEWVLDADKAHTTMYSRINYWRDQQLSDPDSTVVYNGITWDANSKAQSDLNLVLTTNVIPPYWTSYDNEDEEVTKESLEGILAAIVTKGYLIHDRQRTMKKELALLTDPVDILSYSIGWEEE